MLALGLDIDGVLLPIKGKKQDLALVHQQLMHCIQGARVCSITSATDPADRFRRIHDIGWHPHAEYSISRSRPWDKARLLREFADREGCDSAELWDDEPFYLQYAKLYNVRAYLVGDGAWAYEDKNPHQVWSPKGSLLISPDCYAAVRKDLENV